MPPLRALLSATQTLEPGNLDRDRDAVARPPVSPATLRRWHRARPPTNVPSFGLLRVALIFACYLVDANNIVVHKTPRDVRAKGSPAMIAAMTPTGCRIRCLRNS